jgi:hypothetical protein
MQGKCPIYHMPALWEDLEPWPRKLRPGQEQSWLLYHTGVERREIGACLLSPSLPNVHHRFYRVWLLSC